MRDLFRRKGDDPLTNLKTVTRWVRDLPAGDAYAIQEEVVRRLVEFNQAQQNYGRDRLEVLMHLDEATRDMQDALCLQYLRNARMSKAIEARLWLTIHAYYWEVTRAYHGFLMDFVANSGGGRIETQAPLLTARALRGFADIIKWRHFRHEQIDDKVWLRLHNLYRIAEFDNFANEPVKIYAGDPRPFSAAEEYGRTLLLAPFGNGTLMPREIEMVDHWLRNWVGCIRLDSLYDAARHTYYVDTALGQGSRRCGDQDAATSLRYLSTTGLLERLAEVREALRNGTKPATLGLTEDFRLPEGHALIRRVESEWQPPSAGDRRRDERRPQTGQWKVIHDLAAICAELTKTGRRGRAEGAPSAEEMQDIRLYGFVIEHTRERLLEQERAAALQQRKDLWEQRDASRGGVGFRLGRRDGDWVKVGRLVAVSPAEEEHWRVGLVSRVIRQDEETWQVGVRWLDGSGVPATLIPYSADNGLAYIVDETQPPDATPGGMGLWLHDGGDESLLIDGTLYARERSYVLHAAQSGSRLIHLLGVVESGEGWLRVRFEQVAA